MDNTASDIKTTIDNRYRVEQRLDGGGLREVYLAGDRRTGSRVVIKLPWAGVLIDDPGLKERFVRQARAMSRMDHPHIVRVYDVVEHEGHPVAIVQHLGGGSLENRPAADLNDWLPQIADALDHIHAKELVHRDVRPANILFDLNGAVYLGDFGIAKPLRPGSNMFAKLRGAAPPTSALGEPKYMAPEMAEGKALDGRADQYALAVMVYERLAGQMPFDAETPAHLVASHISVAPRPLGEVDARFGEALSQSLQRALSKRRQDRFLSCRAFAEAVLASLGATGTEDSATAAPPASPVPSLQAAEGSWAAQHQPRVAAQWWSWGVAAGIAVLALGVMLMGFPFGHREPHDGRSAPRAADEEQPAAELPATSPPPARPLQPSPPPSRPPAAPIAERPSAPSELWPSPPVPSPPAVWPPDDDAGPPSPPMITPSRPRPGPPSDFAPPVAVAPFSAQQARRHQDAWAEHLGQPREITNSIGMKLVLIPPGEFMMGSPENEEWRRDDEGPQHRVRITKPFYLGVYEVTQEEYERVMGTNPSAFSRDGRNSDLVSGLGTSRFPVERVSWNDAVAFCQKLSALPAERSVGREYRLPTEAEWECACRAGTTTAFHFGDSIDGRQAHFNKDYLNGTGIASLALYQTTTAGSYKANSFGLYDMHGNVWEWCSDWFANDYYVNSPVDDPLGPASGLLRVARGGSWDDDTWHCRSASRFWHEPDHRSPTVGFRAVLVPSDDVGGEPPALREWF